MRRRRAKMPPVTTMPARSANVPGSGVPATLTVGAKAINVGLLRFPLPIAAWNTPALLNLLMVLPFAFAAYRFPVASGLKQPTGRQKHTHHTCVDRVAERLREVEAFAACIVSGFSHPFRLNQAHYTDQTSQRRHRNSHNLNFAGEMQALSDRRKGIEAQLPALAPVERGNLCEEIHGPRPVNQR